MLHCTGKQFLGGQCGDLGEYRGAALLPSKTAVFLWEYNGSRATNSRKFLFLLYLNIGMM